MPNPIVETFVAKRSMGLLICKGLGGLGGSEVTFTYVP